MISTYIGDRKSIFCVFFLVSETRTCGAENQIIKSLKVINYQRWDVFAFAVQAANFLQLMKIFYQLSKALGKVSLVICKPKVKCYLS